MSDATATVEESAELALPEYEPAKVAKAKLKPLPASEREVYYDPSAAGPVGPHLRYPHQRAYFTGQHGSFVPTNLLEREMVRNYLGENADTYRGDTMAEPAVCTCGFKTGNQYALREHKLKFPDRQHDIRF